MLVGLFCLFLWIAGCVITIWAALFAFIHRPTTRRGNSQEPLVRRRPITILKPMKGSFPNIEAFLMSFFTLQYVKGDKLIFCFENDTDDALPIVKRLMTAFHDVPAHISISYYKVGSNPKINNIFNSYKHAETELVLISDDNAFASVDYLDRLENEFHSGVLTAVILGITFGKPSFAAKLESMFMATFYSKALILGHAFGLPLVMGKSMMISRGEFSADYFKKTGQFLAEDFATGLLAQERGLPVKRLSIPVFQNIEKSYTLEKYFKRHERWGVIRKSIALPAFLVEPFVYSFFISGLVGAIGIHLMGVASIANFALTHFLIWFISDLVHINAINSSSSNNLFIWLAREFSYIPLWFNILRTNKIEWKGKIYKIKRGGAIESEK